MANGNATEVTYLLQSAVNYLHLADREKIVA